MGNVTSNVAAKFAFFPPDPPTYDVYKDEDGKYICSGLTADKNVDVHVLETKVGNKIVATFWKHPFGRFTLLYSHAMIIQDMELPLQEDIILYGQSVGSGPTLHLASRQHRLRAVVLHSAILSGIRVLYNVKMTFWFDIFKNIDKIRNVSCPVLVIHGTSDDIVDWSHGKRLWELSREKYDPLWVQGGGHCNLETFPEYIKHLRKFMKAMEKHSFSKRSKANLAPTSSITEGKYKCLRLARK
ncbi:uncharacterized protein [Coffea arabica]|uniref:Uncharacterized protein isoform X2 n=1 Tax=Coffea arabica TaxID=13443 RepID=A0ABM4UPE4_COFAR